MSYIARYIKTPRSKTIIFRDETLTYARFNRELYDAAAVIRRQHFFILYYFGMTNSQKTIFCIAKD